MRTSKVLFLLIVVACLTACGKNVREPIVTETVVAPRIVCNDRPVIDKIQIQDVEFAPVWGYKLLKERDVAVDNSGDEARRLAGNTYVIPKDAQFTEWVALPSEEYEQLAANTANILQQSKQMKAVIDYLSNCIVTYNSSRALDTVRTEITPAITTVPAKAKESKPEPEKSSIETVTEGIQDAVCKKRFWQFWKPKCGSS